ncbi:MAG: helicase-related protein [Ardenticatenaceae bacterium]|nr:helicase-related protein [Ardenticatenaceae bacterium]
MPSRLRDYPFKYTYGPGDDRVNEFYIPALSASVQYDRSTGFFSSTALAVAATGVARLIANGGRMRLLVGAQLAEDDVEAIRRGYDLRARVEAATMRGFAEPESQFVADRLAALAWMIAEGHLDIQVVLPVDGHGIPRPAMEALGYYHPKTGIFTDETGDRLAFTGSSNESFSGWVQNYEEFWVFRSWEGPHAYLAEAIGRFERLWEGREIGWIALPIPEAARQRLLKYRPPRAPTHDPLEPGGHEIDERPAQKLLLSTGQQREQVIVQFLRDVPFFPGASSLGASTAAIQPWPHQFSVSNQAITHFARRYMLADEVGLGKTIEAGLILRQLFLSGLVRRALILAPKSVLRQWQEELYEKFALNVPRYDGAVFIDAFGREIVPPGDNPWDDVSLALASSQLVKRRDRQATLLAARRWNLVLVDEAHHARRKEFQNPTRYRPNRLLELLNALEARTDGLLLMTATPMQVHPIEVWDLVRLLGLSGEWGANAQKFLRFFQELRRPLDQADWSFVFRLVRDEVALAGLDPRFVATAQQEIGPVAWRQVEALLHDHNPGRSLAQLAPPPRAVAIKMVRHHTPLRRLVFRNTRALLRQYVRQGILQANVPTRAPVPVWIPMRPAERALYDRIEEYITEFYQKYEQERKGLGFIMTVYRRRLTSSFYAVRRSLERRLDFLLGKRPGEGASAGLDEDDSEQEDLSLDLEEELAEEGPQHLNREEIEYVEDFLHRLTLLQGRDSKVEQLLADLQQIFRTRDKVLVFTQYTDTMDFLRDQLKEVYGRQVACYSGRGGERWDGVAWVETTKEEIKNDFRTGEELKILLCTEAASEGLNLQTCGVLINYDMPWNPMRVEQRIGRIDRIGQRYREVQIRNYFYEGTVEARVYQALSNRIDWFQAVVGQLQPILAQVGQVIQTLAMVPEAVRQQALKQELERIERALDEAQAGLDLDEWAATGERARPAESPVSLAELAHELTTLPALKPHFRPHESIDDAFWLKTGAQTLAVTFHPERYDAYPNTLRFLTYGNPLLETLLASVPPPADGAQGRLLRLSIGAPLARIAYYALTEETLSPSRLTRLTDLKKLLDHSASTRVWTNAAIEVARADFLGAVEAEWEAFERTQAASRAAGQSSLEASVQELLLQAALVEIALEQQPDLFTQDRSQPSFNEVTVRGLERRGYPFAPALKLVNVGDLYPRPTDPFYLEIQNDAPDKLQRHLADIRRELDRQVRELATVRNEIARQQNPSPSGDTETRFFNW